MNSKPTMAECGTCNRITYQTVIGSRFAPTPPVMLVCRGCGSLNYYDKGKLIKADAHRYERDQKIRERMEKAVSLLGEEFREHLTALCRAKPRYVKEQLALAVKTCESYGRETTLKAVVFCSEQELWSASDLAGVAAALAERTQPIQRTRLPVNDEKYHIEVQIRPLSVYAEAALEVRR